MQEKSEEKFKKEFKDESEKTLQEIVEELEVASEELKKEFTWPKWKKHVNLCFQARVKEFEEIQGIDLSSALDN